MITDDRQGWAELFFDDQRVVLLDICDERGWVETPGSVIVRLGAQQHVGSGVDSGFDQAIHDIELGFILQWTEHAAFTQSDTPRGVLGDVEQCGTPVVDRVMDVEAFERSTSLAVVYERAPHHIGITNIGF